MNNKWVDLNLLNQFFDFDQNKILIEQVLNLYESNSYQLIDELQIAIQQNDYKKIHNISHTLKSTALNLGFIKIRQLMQNLENETEVILKSGAPKALTQLDLIELKKINNESIQILKKYLTDN